MLFCPKTDPPSATILKSLCQRQGLRASSGCVQGNVAVGQLLYRLWMCGGVLFRAVYNSTYGKQTGPLSNENLAYTNNFLRILSKQIFTRRYQ